MKPILSNIRAICLIAILSLSFQATAQNSLHVSVLPPYTNRLADYSNTPGKVVVTVVIHPSLTPHFSGKVFFRGKLRSVSGDIEISSLPGFRPAIPVTLPAGAPGMPITYTLPFHEIQTLFDWNRLNYKGVTIDQIVQYGMPEDTYQFCVQVVDYETLQVVVEETCGPMLNVSLNEPPTILNPAKESVLINALIQNVQFNWAIPPSRTFTNFQYTLRIVEMMEGVNPEEALRAANYPFRFFETTVMLY